jgi:hypothetical protein
MVWKRTTGRGGGMFGQLTSRRPFLFLNLGPPRVPTEPQERIRLTATLELLLVGRIASVSTIAAYCPTVGSHFGGRIHPRFPEIIQATLLLG